MDEDFRSTHGSALRQGVDAVQGIQKPADNLAEQNIALARIFFLHGRDTAYCADRQGMRVYPRPSEPAPNSWTPPM
jgi:hypothetical protein